MRTIEVPRFPHYSAEAEKLLGLPDSPVVHLAVTRLVALLLPHADGTRFDPETVRITAFREASGAALEGLPLANVVGRFRLTLDLSSPPWSELAKPKSRTNWLDWAMAEIREEGLDPGPDANRLATRYGWTPYP